MATAGRAPYSSKIAWVKNAWADESSNTLVPLGTSETSPALPAPGSVTRIETRPGGTPEIHTEGRGLNAKESDSDHDTPSRDAATEYSPALSVSKGRKPWVRSADRN